MYNNCSIFLINSFYYATLVRYINTFMFKQIQNIFHSLEPRVSRIREYSIHHRALSIVLLVTILIQQTHVVSGFANVDSNILSKSNLINNYVYVRTNPIIDDSWIGTRVYTNKQNIVDNFVTSITQKNNPIIIELIPNKINTNPQQNNEESWIGDWKKIKTPNIEMNSASILQTSQILL